MRNDSLELKIFDNSHTFGTDKIGAMIVVGPKGFQKENYRTKRYGSHH